MKPTPAQAARLRKILDRTDPVSGTVSRWEAGYPAGPMENRLRDAGWITVHDVGGHWSTRRYSITDAGRAAIAPKSKVTA